MIKRYIDKIFGLAFREQHGCEDFDSSGVIPAQPVAAQSIWRSDSRLLELLEREMLCDISIPSDFLARLAFAGAADLRDWAEEYNGELVRWRNEEDGGKSLKRAIGGLEELLGNVVPPRRIVRELGLTIPPAGRKSVVRQLIKRYGDDLANLALPNLGALRAVVRLIARAGAAVGRSVLGNPEIITTDVALPRRRDGRPA